MHHVVYCFYVIRLFLGAYKGFVMSICMKSVRRTALLLGMAFSAILMALSIVWVIRSIGV